jgi:hypothetical protein
MSKPLTRRQLVALATDLPARINAAHADCAKAMSSAIGHAIRAGELLLRAKAGVGHGQWQKWQRDNGLAANVSNRRKI